MSDNNFEDWYLKEVDREDELYGKGICTFCGKEGYHLECLNRH